MYADSNGMDVAMRTMRRTLAMLVFLGAITSPFATETTAQQAEHGVLAKGTPWATDYVIVTTGTPGPTVMVTGGIHGNEPAGAAAAAQVASWEIVRGTLIVVPQVNRPGLAANTRWLPGRPKASRDLNRNFPRKAGAAPVGTLARALWSFVRTKKPDWLIDLHEGYDFTQINKKSVGSSIIAADDERATDRARRMLAALNETIENPKRTFVLKSKPVNGSLARAAFRRLGIPSMIIETTKKKQPLSLRTRQHRILLNRLLHDLGMTVDGPHKLRRARGAQGTTKRIAVYDASGTGGRGVKEIHRLLRDKAALDAEPIGALEIRHGGLDRYDAVIFPGGSGSRQAKALGRRGTEAVRRFVASGGGYVGICAGAYLAARNYSWSLAILDAKVIDRKHWRRGTGSVRLELTDAGQAFLGAPARTATVRYANGPIYWPAGDPAIPDYTPLATFASEIAKHGAPTGVMIGTTAGARGRYGDGRVICWSPHPELTKGLGRWLVRTATWAAAGD